MEYLFVKDLLDAKVLLSYTNQELADLFNVSVMTINRWLNVENLPSFTQMDNVYSTLYKKGIKLNLINEELYKSQNDANNLILFHGSKEGISEDLSIKYSNSAKDFGKGFYLGENVKQAISFVSNYKNPSLYFVKLSNLTSLKIKEFSVSKEWMILVAYFRGRIDKYKDSEYLKTLLNDINDVDVIVAPIADNSMYSIINEFIEGMITDEQCLNSLSANRLGRQYVILNDNVLNNNVTLLKKSFICSEEKQTYEKEKESEKNIGKNKMILAIREYAGKGQYIEELLK